MIGYKRIRKDFIAPNGFKYEIGKIYELDKNEKLEICKCGFYFCKNPIDVLAYYQSDDTIIVKVEALGEIVHQGTKYATDKIRILRQYHKEELHELVLGSEGNIQPNKFNTGNYNTGGWNSGNYNTGCYNSGNHNTGKCNSGNGNTGVLNDGNFNSGDTNSGSRNSGNRNSGDRNSGICNSGNCNAGDYNIGDNNTGDHNTGNYNTGDYNNGDCNTGDYNSGSYNTGIFNTDKPLMRAFNKETTMTLTNFIGSLDYSFDTLCERIYNKNLIKGDREKIEALPNYDPDIFTEITGIKFDCDKDDNEIKEAIDEINDEIESLLTEIELKRKKINELKSKSN